MTKSEVANAFMHIMGEYKNKQHHDPHFDDYVDLYNLYSDLSNLYDDRVKSKRLHVHDLLSANPYDGDYRMRVEHIEREAPETTRLLKKHLQNTGQPKSAVIDCVNSIFQAITE